MSNMWLELTIYIITLCYGMAGIIFFYFFLIKDDYIQYKKGDSLTLWILLLAMCIAFGPIVYVVVALVEYMYNKQKRRNKK